LAGENSTILKFCKSSKEEMEHNPAAENKMENTVHNNQSD
jgi:hypothetical protein